MPLLRARGTGRSAGLSLSVLGLGVEGGIGGRPGSRGPGQVRDSRKVRPGAPTSRAAS